MPKSMKKAIRLRCTDGRTDPNYRKVSVLIRRQQICVLLIIQKLEDNTKQLSVISKYISL